MDADLDTEQAVEGAAPLEIVRTMVGEQKDGGTRGVRALGPSASLLVGRSARPVLGGVLPVLGAQDQVEKWTPSARYVISDGSVTQRGEPSQMYAGHLCGSPPVWMETHSVELERADWRAWALLPGTKRPTLLGSSDHLVPRKDPPPPIDEEHLAASATTAYWPITVPDGDSWIPAIAGAELSARPSPRVVVRDAVYPQIDRENALLYVRRDRSDEGLPTGGFQVRRHDGGHDSLVVAGTMAPKSILEGFVSDRGRYALVVNDPPRGPMGIQDSAVMAVWGAGIDGVLRIKLHDAAAELSMSGNLLTWGNGSGNYDGGQYVLDLRDRSLYQVHSNKGGSYIYTCDGYVGWSDFPNEPGHHAADFILARWK